MTAPDASTPLLNPQLEVRVSKWTPIEVVVALYFMSIITITPIQQFYVITVIAGQHNRSDFINQDISACNKSKNEDNEIQQEASEFLMYLGFCSTFLSVIPILFMGSVADRFGRKLVIYICLGGLLVKETIYIVVIHFQLSLYILYLGQVIEGLSGYFGAMMMAMFGMTADITTPGKNRAFRISVVEATAAISASFTMLGVGYWIKYGGFYYPMVFACVVTIATTVFCVFFIPETSNLNFRNHGENFCSKTYLFKCFLIYYYNSPIGRRKKLIASLFVIALSGAAILGRSSVQTLFLLNAPLCWTEVHIQIFSCVSTLVLWGAIIVVVRILHMFTEDYGILIVGTASAATSLLLFAFAEHDWTVYLYVAVGIFASSVFPLVRSMMSRLCTRDEQGSLFATIASTELLFTAFSQLIYGGIYKLSVSSFPGLVFLIMACVLFVVLMITIMLYKWMKKDNIPSTWAPIN